MFANNILIFCRAIPSSDAFLAKLLTIYQDSSSQRINHMKSLIFMGICSRRVSYRIKETFKFKSTDLPSLMIGNLVKLIFSPSLLPLGANCLVGMQTPCLLLAGLFWLSMCSLVCLSTLIWSFPSQKVFVLQFKTIWGIFFGLVVSPNLGPTLLVGTRCVFQSLKVAWSSAKSMKLTQLALSNWVGVPFLLPPCGPLGSGLGTSGKASPALFSPTPWALVFGGRSNYGWFPVVGNQMENRWRLHCESLEGLMVRWCAPCFSVPGSRVRFECFDELHH